jgi:ectoine hydroxylase-related dioxygenase (phytanoyl-CoA dioxygenase family)
VPRRQPLTDSPLTGAAEHFREHGWVLVPSLIPAEDIAAAQPALFGLYPTPAEVASGERTARTAPFLEADTTSGTWGTGDRRFVPGQFVGLKAAPFGDAALDNLPLHHNILDLVVALLGTDDIRLYQAETFAKYTGVAPYAQPLHIDETNHSLVPPRRDGRYRQVQLFLYLSDVTEDRGATRVVSNTISHDVANTRWYFHNSGQVRFDDDEVAAVGPAGSVLAYSADTVHRGADMTEPGAGRFFFNLGYRCAGVDWTGDLPWPRRGIEPAIPQWMQGLDPRQLAALGFPPPGHDYWDEQTLAATAARYPALDLGAWRNAL